VSNDPPELPADCEVRPDDLHGIRRALGKTQEQMAQLLGVSTRAVQSYEQGWRPVPPHVQKMAVFLLCASRRKGRAEPCWRIRRCSPATRAGCPAHQLKEGELCWLVIGDACPAFAALSGKEQAAHCPVLAERLRATQATDRAAPP
jgi:DNA-binding XRE family transcriptional regulator